MALKVLYRCNDGSGTTLLDSSGNAVNATLVGGATFGAGKYGGGLVLDGTTGYATAAVSALLSVSATFTVAMWVNIADTITLQNLIDSCISVNDRMSITINAGRINAAVYTGAFTGKYGSASLGWQHVAMVRTATEVLLYINGVAQTSTAQSSVSATAGTRFGCRNDGKQFFVGGLDEIRIYDSDESANIAAIMADSGSASTLLARRRRMMQSCV